jgi:predicted nucleic acid-binding protein
MAQPRLRVALDANVLIAGIWSPRWPYEVMRSALQGLFDVVLPEQVVAEVRRHLTHPTQEAAFDSFLASSSYEELAMPPREDVAANLDLVRSEKDVPIALALLENHVDIFVTNDRDFTDPGAAAERFTLQVQTMLAAVFLRDVLGWSSEALEGIRNRDWDDVITDTDLRPGNE